MLSPPLWGQKDLARFMPPQKKPIISIAADINQYWNLAAEEDTLPPILREHHDAMREGRRYSFSVAAHVDDQFLLGVEYFHAYTKHATPESYWIINNVNRKGAISESVHHNFYGVFVKKYFDLTEEYTIGVGISPGLYSYVQYSDYAGVWFILQGQDFAVDIHLDGLFVMDNNWAFYLRGSFCSAVIVTPYYTDANFTREPLTNDPLNLSNLRAGVGIRYSFLMER